MFCRFPFFFTVEGGPWPGGKVACGPVRGAHVLGCVVPARRDSGGVFKASVVPNQVWGREFAMCTSD